METQISNGPEPEPQQPLHQAVPREATFAALLYLATGCLFTAAQCRILLAVYERRNGLFHAHLPPCPNCQGRGWLPHLVEGVWPVCDACYGSGFVVAQVQAQAQATQSEAEAEGTNSTPQTGETEQ